MSEDLGDGEHANVGAGGRGPVPGAQESGNDAAHALREDSSAGRTKRKEERKGRTSAPGTGRAPRLEGAVSPVDGVHRRRRRPRQASAGVVVADGLHDARQGSAEHAQHPRQRHRRHPPLAWSSNAWSRVTPPLPNFFFFKWEFPSYM